MKKVIVLFSTIALITALVATYAVKSNITDTVYLCNLQNNVCDIGLNATLLPNGAPAGQLQAATVIVSCNDLCALKRMFITRFNSLV